MKTIRYFFMVTAIICISSLCVSSCILVNVMSMTILYSVVALLGILGILVAVGVLTIDLRLPSNLRKLEVELLEVSDHYKDLQEFKKKHFDSMDEQEKSLLNDQERAIKIYMTALKERYTLLKSKKQ